jgi:LacI family transcriptional regulator
MNSPSSGGTTPDAARRATIKDVARLAGVSPSTAARALNGGGYAAEAVKIRVQQAADRLGYVRDAQASNLRKRESRTVGVLVSDLRNPFYADLAAGVGRVAHDNGYTMILTDDRGSQEQEMEAVRNFLSMRVAGVIMTPLTAEAPALLLSQGVPVVEADRTFSGGACDSVLVDNKAATRRMSDHLISLGHRRIALIVDETAWTTGADRFSGYEESLKEHGIAVDPDLVVRCGWDADAARKAAVDVLAGKDRPTAVFAANNVIAEGVWRAAMDLGFRVPADVSIVSFDDAAWMSMVSPGLTAVAQDALALGEVSMQRILNRIAHPESGPQESVLAARILARGSTAAPQSR